MAKYNAIHSCGHTERVDLIGPRNSREWRLERIAQKPCDACWRAEREAENAKRNAEAAKENQAMELPALVGSEKQIAWAETVRLGILRSIDETVSNPYYGRVRSHPRLQSALDSLYGETRAHWWIDQRECPSYSLLTNLLDAPAALSIPDTTTTEDRLTAQAEATVRPENCKTNTVAEIRVMGATIQISFPEKREAFRELMHTLHYKWAETHWQRTTNQFAGTADDRAVEAGHRILAAGFSIRLYDEQLRARAIAGEYTPEPERWVMKSTEGKYKDWFVIRWPREQDFYAAAKRLPGSRYSEGRVFVPAGEYEQVLDFAESHGFEISPGAQRLVEAARVARGAMLVANIKLIETEPPPPAPGRLPPMLEMPGEVSVANELLDD